MLGLGAGVSTSSPTEPKYSLSLDGTGDYLALDSFASALSDDMAYSLSIWFKGDSNDSSADNENILFSAHDAGSGNIIRIGVDNNGTKGVFYSDASTGDHGNLGSVDLDDGAWHNIIITRTAGAGDRQSTLYIDGGSAITTNLDDTDPQWNDATRVSIGQEFDGATKTDFYTGNIDEVAFWDVELDNASRLRVFTAGLEGHNLTSNKDAYDNSGDLVGYWRMGNGLLDDKVNGIVHNQVNPGLGDEEIPNGDFANGFDDWTNGSKWSVANNVATLASTSSATDSTLTSSATLTASKYYKLTYTISNRTSNGLALVSGNVSIPSTDGNKTVIFTGQTVLSVKRFGEPSALSISNISVREIKGNPGFTSGGATFLPDTLNLGFGAELWESPASTNGSVANWVAYGNNGLETVNESVQITYVDNEEGAYMYFRAPTDISTNLTVGARYKMSCNIKVSSGGSVVLNIAQEGGLGNISSTAVTSTEFIRKEMYFTAGHVSNSYLKVISMGAEEVATLDGFSLKELTY